MSSCGRPRRSTRKPTLKVYSLSVASVRPSRKLSQGLCLDYSNAVHNAERWVLSLDATIETLREAVYRIETPIQEYLAIIGGLSRKMRLKILEVKKLRSSLVVNINPRYFSCACQLRCYHRLPVKNKETIVAAAFAPQTLIQRRFPPLLPSPLASKSLT